MTARAAFREADASRAIRAAVRAGLPPSECVIDPANGTIRLVFGAAPGAPSANPLDRLLDHGP